jgi:hypothetical protein
MDMNAMIALANDKISCGPSCQNDRKIEKLRQIYNTSKQKLIDAPKEFSAAEKNYFINLNGDEDYKLMMKNRTNVTIQNMKKKLNEKHSSFVSDLKKSTNEYGTTVVYYNNMDEMLKKSTKEYKKYKQNIEDYKAKMNTNNRRAFYDDGEMDWLTNIRYVLLIIYFVIFIAIIIKIDFIGNELYKNYYVWLIIITYILFGLYVDWVSKMIYYLRNKLYYIFQNETPRNVYAEAH